MEKEKHKIRLKFAYTHHWIDHPLRIILYIDDRPINIDFGSNKSEVVVDKKIAIDYRFQTKTKPILKLIRLMKLLMIL